MRRISLLILFLFLLPSVEAAVSGSTTTIIRLLTPDSDFTHRTGRKHGGAWEVKASRDEAEYALKGVRKALPLPPALYRLTLALRTTPPSVPSYLEGTFNFITVEVWDRSAKELIAQRQLQLCDFGGVKKTVERWIDFSTRGRTGHRFDVRVKWHGLVTGRIVSLKLERFPEVSLKELNAKAERLGAAMQNHFVENGLAVSRRPDQVKADPSGTVTAYYAASLAWKLAVTGDKAAEKSLEQTLAALHELVRESPPYDKDFFTAYFFAMATAHPLIKNLKLQDAMEKDVERLASLFLEKGWQLPSDADPRMGYTPFLTKWELQTETARLLNDDRLHNRLIGFCEATRHQFPLLSAWSDIDKSINAIRRKDSEKLSGLAVIAINSVIGVMEALRSELENEESEVFPARFLAPESQGKLLSDTLTNVIQRFPKNKDAQRLYKLSDFRVMAGNALCALQIVRAAHRITGLEQFEEYYGFNLYTQDTLLQTASDWFGIVDDLSVLLNGNDFADTARDGATVPLSLANLVFLESNSIVKDKYLAVLQRWWTHRANDDNPLWAAIYLACGGEDRGNAFSIHRALQQYPEDRMGHGPDYWKRMAKRKAIKYGGGWNDGFSREPLPVAQRPKAFFLWEQNSRSLKSDEIREYPPVDFLFLYWFARYNDLLAQAIVLPPPDFQRK